MLGAEEPLGHSEHMSGGFLGRLFGRGEQAGHDDRFAVPPVPTSADLLASLDRVEVMVGAGAVPAPVGCDPGEPGIGGAGADPTSSAPPPEVDPNFSARNLP